MSTYALFDIPFATPGPPGDVVDAVLSAHLEAATFAAAKQVIPNKYAEVVEGPDARLVVLVQIQRRLCRLQVLWYIYADLQLFAVVLAAKSLEESWVVRLRQVQTLNGLNVETEVRQR